MDDLYVQYNRFDPTSFADLQDALNAKDVTGVVLDLRHNFGGEVFVLNQLNDVFRNWLAADDAHHLEIATLRNTFSAASLLVAKLASQSRVQVAGEAIGWLPIRLGAITAISPCLQRYSDQRLDHFNSARAQTTRARRSSRSCRLS